jgi:hypothetical protein
MRTFGTLVGIMMGAESEIVGKGIVGVEFGNVGVESIFEGGIL